MKFIDYLAGFADYISHGFYMPMTINNEQPAPIANDQPAIWDLVINDMHERDQVGRQRYGVPKYEISVIEVKESI